MTSTIEPLQTRLSNGWHVLVGHLIERNFYLQFVWIRIQIPPAYLTLSLNLSCYIFAIISLLLTLSEMFGGSPIYQSRNTLRKIIGTFEGSTAMPPAFVSRFLLKRIKT